MGKVAKIKPDKVKLKSILEQIPEDKQEVATDLIRELSFMCEALDELKKNVRENGAITKFEQGKQKMMIENPAMKSYNTTIQRYGAIYKQLTDLIPRVQQTAQENDDFDDFINGREDV